MRRPHWLLLRGVAGGLAGLSGALAFGTEGALRIVFALTSIVLVMAVIAMSKRATQAPSVKPLTEPHPESRAARRRQQRAADKSRHRR